MENEQLKPEELDRHVQNGTFRLAFVGMSNSGKSYRSRILQNERKFFWYQVDEEIAKIVGLASLEYLSDWLGYPYSKRYKEHAQQYFEAEEKCTYLKDLDTKGNNLVFDTTGSVVYLSDETKHWLYEECLVVHMEVGESDIEKLFVRFFESPKPVVWGDSFTIKEGESEKEALKRSYRNLLSDRLSKYYELAHVSIPARELYDKTGKETLEIIKQHL